MQTTAAVEIRLLFASDIAAAMRLKDAAGWNQTEADWRRLLLLEPHGCFCAVKNGRVVGTTTTTTYGNALAWIGMVLVDPDERRQGIATKLMEVALGYLKGKVHTVKLDATPQGKPVYEKFGFQVESLVERWSGAAVATGRDTQHSTPVDRDDLRDLLLLDRRAFNADRSELLKKLIDEASVAPVLVRSAAGALSGYATARSGTRAAYIGPLVAEDPLHVETLLDQVLSQLAGEHVYLDVNTECSAGANVLSERGFVKERDLVRMSTRSSGPKTSPLVFAISGPETG
jgi:GNAT superfamily N-acetyltransferase